MNFNWVLEQFSLADGNYIHNIIESIDKEGIIGIELGSFTGSSSIFIGKAVQSKNGKLFCVDRWSTYKDEDSSLNPMYTNNNILQIFRDNIELAGLTSNVFPIVGDSKLVHSLIANESLDFVFIDCDHKYSGIKQDLYNWFPKIKSGGILCGHDYEYDRIKRFDKEHINKYCEEDYVGDIHCGVVKAIDELFEDNISFGGSSGWCVYKD